MEFLLLAIVPLTFIFLYVYKKMKKDPYALTAKHSSERAFPGPTEDLEAFIRTALKNAGFKEIKPSVTGGYAATTGLTLWSFGENIAVARMQNENGETVQFRSTCDFPYQVGDWGKNRRNATRFFKELEALLGRAA
jgi:hypothetical protein